MGNIKINATAEPARLQLRLGSLAWPLLTLALLLLFNLFFTPHFFQIEIKNGHLFGSLIDILNRAAPTMLLAIGMTLVIATAGIDISVGSVLAIAGAIAAVLIAKANAPILLVFTVPVIAAVIFGAWNGMLISYVGIQPIIATLVLLTAGRGVAQLVTDGQIINFHRAPFEYIGGSTGFLFGLPFPIIIVAAVFILTQFMTRRTALGLFIEAVGCNATASRYSGINDKSVKMTVYMFSGFCASIAGMITASNIKAADPNSAGLLLEMDAILAVVIGGTPMNGGKFSLAGSMIGALIMQTLTTTILTRGVPVQATLVVRALVVILVCLLQSEEFRKSLQTRMGAQLRRSSVCE